MPYTDDQTMLCLAGLAYRGFNDAAVGRFHGDAVQRAIQHGLDDLAPVKGEWDLVWGPAVYRSPTSLLDDELMYVVRRRQAPARYVVAIRGTNPVSAFDWVFGDLWAAKTTAWRYGNGSARISLSSALGLAILQGLRSDGPRRDDALWQAIDARLAGASGLEERLVAAVTRFGGQALAPLRNELVELTQELLQFRSSQPMDGDDAHVRSLASLWKSHVRLEVVALVNAAEALGGGRVELALLALLEDETRLRTSLGVGTDLSTFLACAVERAREEKPEEPVEVIVTGHSKGGALSSTVALWLCETQGRDARPAERWDPDRRATVHCWSFAGPTAGNADFAKRSDDLLGPRCHRIANRLDVVPHAWASVDLARIPTLYDAKVVAPLPALDDLVGTITALTSDLQYTQVGNLFTELPGTVDSTKPLFFEQAVHQHMQAYLDALKLGVDTVTLFDPLASLPRWTREESR